MQYTTTAKKTRIIDLLRASGEEDLGAGLLRLATLAAAMHRAEVAAEASRDGGGHPLQEVARANGLARSSAVAASRGSDHTEVVR